MEDRTQKEKAAPSSDAAAATPFFARFLEAQHGNEAETKPAGANQTLKYPSDRDEWDFNVTLVAEAAAAKDGPSRMTLKYPSDRDEIDHVYYH